MTISSFHFHFSPFPGGGLLFTHLERRLAGGLAFS